MAGEEPLIRATQSIAQSECPASVCVYIEDCTIISANQNSTYDRLLRGGKTAQGLSGGGGLHYCCRRNHPTRFCYVSSLGIAKLVAATGNSVAASRISNRSDSCVGVRHHTARHSNHA